MHRCRYVIVRTDRAEIIALKITVVFTGCSSRANSKSGASVETTTKDNEF